MANLEELLETRKRLQRLWREGNRQANEISDAFKSGTVAGDQAEQLKEKMREIKRAFTELEKQLAENERQLKELNGE